MKLLSKIFLCALFFAVVSCRKDKAADEVYVNPIELHLSYEMFGKSEQFSTPLSVQLTNITEQIFKTVSTDLMGNVVLDELLPGEYTISVTGSLTPEQVEMLTGEKTDKGYNLGGFLSSIKLRLATPYSIEIPIIGQIPSTLVFKELYYCGSRTATQGTYRNDGFFSIYNNSDSPVGLNDIYIASLENYGGLGTAGPLWPGETQGAYENVYAKTVWKIVAGEKHIELKPGQAVVIATMAAPHNLDPLLNPSSPVDLSNADYEAYVVSPTNTYTNYPAQDMKLAFWPSYAYLWRLSVFGQGMVLIKATDAQFAAFETVTLPQEFQDAFEEEEYWLCKKIPNSFVVDAVDLIQNATATNTKRLHYSLDSGYASVGGTYLGKSVIRKVSGVISGITYYQDTNDSSADFEINDIPLSR
ncbi:MAG: DUF4876 domain-containing protein [Bacteroidales bacterium]